MRCLTDSEQREWLIKNGQIENPYGNNSSSGKFYHQFCTPTRLAAIESFSDSYLNLWKDGEALLVVTDWALYQPYEMRLFELARRAHGENRNLIEATGHIFSIEEKDDLTALFSLTVAYQWKAYLYLPLAKTTLFNWKGEVFDFWTDNFDNSTELLDLQKAFRLKKTGLLSTKLYWIGKKAMWRFNNYIKARRS